MYMCIYAYIYRSTSWSWTPRSRKMPSWLVSFALTPSPILPSSGAVCLCACVRVYTHTLAYAREKGRFRVDVIPHFALIRRARARSLSLCACVCTHTLAYAREKGPFRVDAIPHLAMHIHIHKRIRTRSADRKLKTTLTGYIPPQAMAEVRGLV
jgi:hypothetical protein